jgi:NAD(P)-dependent dehydrogenase (short-subunit alcohol dehydrogenase family)
MLFAARGYATVIVDFSEPGGRETEQRIRAAGGEARFIACNVAEDDQVAAAVAGTIAAYGRLDAAFNAAGTDGEVGSMTADCSVPNWHRVIGINLTGLWFCLRHQIPAMLANGGGAIVNCASTAGVRGAAWCGAYTASKHGVVGLTKAAALEYASLGVRINAVCPGMVDTPMTQREGMADMLKPLIAASPLQRIGKPDEIAAAAVWLCSPEASLVHGQALAVDGALTSR